MILESNEELDESHDEFPDLGFDNQEIPSQDVDNLASYQKKTTFSNGKTSIKTLNPPSTTLVGVSKSIGFSSNPSVVHFSGFTVGEVAEYEVSIVNTSAVSQRLSVLPLTTEHFKLEYVKCGTLAPGMAQKIKIKFYPKEYTYYYDALRIHADQQDLHVPIHAYPVVNVVTFPKAISFGNTPLCEEVTRTISLKCSVPVDFSFSVEVLRPHAYFQIEPREGIIPAKGSCTIKITFNAITLGTCLTSIRLYVGQYNFVPLECVISARAVSGLIECKELAVVEERLAAKLAETGNEITKKLGTTMLQSTRTFKSAQTMNENRKVEDEVISKLLSKTFSNAPDVGTVLVDAMVDSPLLDSKVPTKETSGAMIGMKKVIGDLKATQPVRPKGIGSGNVFDPGAEYMSSKHKKHSATTTKTNQATTNASTSSTNLSNEKVVEGLRIPNDLNSTYAVNYVLTQEPGKLKPKDLKAAIEKNREERKRSMEEQEKLRELSGVGHDEAKGSLNLQSILAEEALNVEEGDAFKRQLREMAFLADVEEVKEIESQKAFRVSEEYVGSNILTQDEIEIIRQQRKMYELHRLKNEWRSIQARRNHEFISTEANKSGSTLMRPSAPRDIDFSEEIKTLSFDPNSNDVWSKRLNTLRKFVGIVSKWVVRQRVSKRLAKLKLVLSNNQVVDRESCKRFVANENAAQKLGGNKSALSGVKDKDTNKLLTDGGATATSLTARRAADEKKSLAQLICSMPNQALVNKLASEKSLHKPYVPSREMAKRVLFPRFVDDESNMRKPIKSRPLEAHLNFDDRTYFILTPRVEYYDMGYEKEKVALTPLYFVPNIPLLKNQQGAKEEKSIRPSADDIVSQQDIENALKSLDQFSSALFPPPPCDTNGMKMPLDDEIETPEWLSQPISEPVYNSTGEYYNSHNVYKPRPELRSYPPLPEMIETDADWVLRPTLQKFDYDKDSTLRTKLMETPGFDSVNYYLLGNHHSRIGESYPPCGPTLTNFYMPDYDRHKSGLHCLTNDHERTLHGRDLDVSELKDCQEKEDVLTDSDSDDEDAYDEPKPTMFSVRELLSRPIKKDETSAVGNEGDKGKKGLKKAESKVVDEKKVEPKVANPPPMPSPTKSMAIGVGDDAFSVLDDASRQYDQVELLRDRKILEFASYLKKEKREREANYYNQLLAINQKANVCPTLGVTIQLPLSMFEEELAGIVEKQVPMIQNTFGYANPGASTTNFMSPSKVV